MTVFFRTKSGGEKMYCYIFGALPDKNFDYEITESDLVIAADSGVKNVEKFNITPDYIIGDFDSLGYEPNSDNTIVHPIEKDDTDTMLAVKKGIECGYKKFRIFGCIGGRLDHTFANIQIAAYISENGGWAEFFGDNENFTIIHNEEIKFNEKYSGNISVFALENSKNVNIDGLFYEMKNGELTPYFPLGVSNKFINKKCSISVEKGTLLIIWENNNTY